MAIDKDMTMATDKDISQFLKSVLDQDYAPIVLCDIHHIIVYMNPSAARRYHAAGGYDLVGKSLMVCHNNASRKRIEDALALFASGKEHNVVYESRNDRENKDVYIVALRDSDGALIGYYEKHEYRTHETAGFYEEVTTQSPS